MAKTKYTVVISFEIEGDEWEFNTYEDYSLGFWNAEEQHRLRDQFSNMFNASSVQVKPYDVALSESERILLQEHEKQEQMNSIVDSVAREENCLNAIWSMSEELLLDEEPAFTGKRNVVYKDHWGHNPISLEVVDPTWRDLFRIADKLIEMSGDSHHVFIEGFERYGNDIILYTGS